MNPRLDLALIICLSIIIYALVTGGFWYYSHHAGSRAARQLRDAHKRSPILTWAYHAGRFAYFIGLPYAGLRLGVIPASMMGLGDWTATEGGVLASIGVALAALVVLSATWRACSRYLPEQTDVSDARRQDRHWAAAMLDVIYLEVHWAFYRTGPILWLGGDYYTGSLMGALLIAFEELLNPRVRNALRRPDTGIDVLVRWGTMVSMTMAFYFTRSLWLVTVLHGLVESAVIFLGRRIRREPTVRDSSLFPDESS